MLTGARSWLEPAMVMLGPWALAAARLPWIEVVAQSGLALLGALLVHRLGTPVLLRVTRRFPFSHRLVRYCHRIGQAVLSLFLLQLVLEGADRGLRGIATAGHVNALLLTIALTWLGVRSVHAIADTIIALHPAEAGTNMPARRIQTQTRVLSHSLSALVVVIGLGMAFSNLPLMRQIGATLLASAGVAGLVVGFAAKPVLGNLLAGMQIALTQPISLGDVVIVEQEWGWIDEITGTYVVIRIWDERRLVVPLQWFIEHPFQNWTRNQTAILGTVFAAVDHRMPIDALRREAERLCAAAPEWDQRVCVTHVVDNTERAVQVRVLLSAADAGLCWDLRCRVREGLVTFMQREYPECLPRTRVSMEPPAAGPAAAGRPTGTPQPKSGLH